MAERSLDYKIMPKLQWQLPIKNFLKQPYRYKKAIRYRFLIAFGYGLFVTFFLLIYKPFGLHLAPQEWLIKVGIKYGVITFITVFVNSFLKYYVAFKLGKWNNQLELISSFIILFQIGFFNALFASMDMSKLSFLEIFWRIQWNTLKLGIIPITFEIVLERNQYLTRYLKQYEQSEVNNKRFILLKDLKRNISKVKLEDIILVKSDGHYLRVYTKTSFFYIRETMSQFHEKLGNTLFRRVHRSSLINIDHILEINRRNRNTYALIMSNGDKVNISESYKDTIRDYLRLSEART